jgi:hypothetical protein
VFLMSNSSNARLLRSVLFAALLLGTAPAIWVVFEGEHAAAEQPNRAGLVVTFSDGSTLSRCIEFSEEEINGAELLTRSGLPLVSWGTGAGAAICKIGDEGCNNPNDCFCECSGSDCQYWAYYALEGGQWQYASAGASLREVHNGDVDGWAWGSGKAGQGAMPPLLTFEEICPPIVPTVAPVPPTEPPLMPATQSPTPPVAQETAIAPAAIAGTVAAVSPPATATKATPQTPATHTTPGQSAAERANAEPSEKDNGSSFPRQLIAFVGVAAALLVTAVILVRRRAGG